MLNYIQSRQFISTRCHLCFCGFVRTVANDDNCVVQILDGVAALDRGAVTAAKIFSGHVRAIVNESTAARPEERRESVRFNIYHDDAIVRILL
jgi:hypothetical protein